MAKMKLSNICNPKQWKTLPTSKLLEEGYPVYGANGIIGYYSEFNHENPVVAVTCRGATCGSINITVPKAYVTGNAMCLDDVRSDIEMEYLYYCLKHYDFNNIISGSAQPQITRQGMDKIYITVCTHNEQISIVNKLKRVERIIELRKQELQFLDNLIKARFVEMFGDPISNPMGWDKKPLANECDIVTGNTPSRKVPEYYGNYIEWIKSDNINTPNAILTTAEEYLSEAGLKVGRSVGAGAILMTCIAGSLGCIGNVAIANRMVSFNQQINGIVPKKNNTWFMYILFELSKRRIQSTINMALKGILSKGQLAEMEFIFPPVKLQNEFGDFVEQVNKSKFAVQKALDKTQLLFDSLMQEYFG